MVAITIIVLISFLGSFLCSLSEAALYAASRGRIETLRRLRSRAGERLSLLRDRVEEPIAAILLVNTTVMTFGAIWSGALVEKYYGSVWMGVFSAGFTLLILFMSEIVPKSLGVRFADNIAPNLAWPLQIAIWALWPFVRLSVLLTRIFGRSRRSSHPTEQDIISMALLSEAGGEILKQETRWIRNILRLNDIKVKDIMTPYGRIAQVPASLPLSNVKADWNLWRYSRILVSAQDEPDNILGMVLRRSVFAALLRRGGDTTIEALMQPVLFVRGESPAHDLIGFFVRNKTQLAVVKDAGDKLIGVVTMEDVLEDMIGAEIE